MDTDKEIVRLYQPCANDESAQMLQLTDASYFDIGYISNIKRNGKHCVMRAKSNINPITVSATNSQESAIACLAGKQLHSVTLNQH